MNQPKKQISYKLSLKKNLVYEYCLELHNNISETDTCDFTFYCSNKAIPVHAAVIALSSGLMKDLSNQPNIAPSSVHLPDYKESTVVNFVKFLYTGELFIPETEFDDFKSLCDEFIVNLPEAIVFNVAGTEEEDYISAPAEEFPHETFSDEAEEIDPTEEEVIDDHSFVKIDPEDYQSTSALVQDYHSIDESADFSEELPRKTSRLQKDEMELTKHITGNKLGVKRSRDEFLQDQNYGDNLSEQPMNENLQVALEAIKSGKMNTFQASKIFRIPKTTLYRWINKKR